MFLVCVLQGLAISTVTHSVQTVRRPLPSIVAVTPIWIEVDQRGTHRYVVCSWSVVMHPDET